MKLLLRRDQRSGLLGGKPTFSLDVRAEITADEKAAIAKYKLGDTVLYESHVTLDRGSGLLGVSIDPGTQGRRPTESGEAPHPR